MAEGKEVERLGVWIRLFGRVWGPRLYGTALILGPLGAISAIIVTYLPKGGGEKKSPPVVIFPIPDTHPPRPEHVEEEAELQIPIAADGSHKDDDSGWFVVPPLVRLNGTVPYKKQVTGINTYLIRTVENGPQSQLVETSRVQLKGSLSAGQIIAELDTGSVISELYPSHPHGLYRLHYTVAGKDSPGFAFNYALRANYTKQPWSFNAKDVFTTGDEGHSLVMRHSRRVGGYSAIELGQRFNFGKGIRIKGRFSALPLDAEDIVGLDVCVLNHDTGDIATASFEAGKTPVAVLRKRFNQRDDVSDPPGYTIHVASDGRTDNYFEIAYVVDRDEIRGSLWIGQQPVDLRRSPEATLTLMRSRRPWNPDRIELRIWKGGTIELKSLCIAEAESDSLETVVIGEASPRKPPN